MSATGAVPVTVITNPTNLGFPAAINQGLREARGEYLVLLNNDDGGDGRLAGPADRAPGRNDRWWASSGRCPTMPLRRSWSRACRITTSSICTTFARRWREEHRGQWFTVPKLSGFCLLMKRAVYEAIGGLDERFGLGFFDDDDLAERARRAGFELAVAHDLFVHHFGSRTFAGNGIDAGKLLDENARRFAAKWGLAATKASGSCFSRGGRGRRFLRTRSGNLPARSTRRGALVTSQCIQRRRHRDDQGQGSLTMIVRDEEEKPAHCLESVRGIFDEIIVVDTGSTDRTREIARSFGAKVFDFVWVDSFAAARNECTGACHRRLCVLAGCRRCGRAG